MHRTTLGTFARLRSTQSPALTHGPRHRIGHQPPTALSPLAVLKAILMETMDCPSVRPFSTDSYLPPHLLDAAQRAIAAAEGHRVAGRVGA